MNGPDARIPQSAIASMLAEARADLERARANHPQLVELAEDRIAHLEAVLLTYGEAAS